MRTLDDALLAEQKKYELDYVLRMTFTLDADEVVLEKDVIKKLNHLEEPWQINAKEVKFDNSDSYFTSKSLKGYKAVIEYGLRAKGGPLYSAASPMWVTGQQMGSIPGELECELTMLGIPDMMDEDTALEDYIPSENREHRDSGEETTQETDYTLIKEIELTESLPYARVSFQLKTSSASGVAYGRVYKNGAAIGTIRSNGTVEYQTFSEDFTGWSAGDLIQIYAKISNASYIASVKGMEIYSVDAAIYKTTKTILIEIAGATLPCFSHCQAFPIVFDSEDSLIDTYCPKDGIRFFEGSTRLAAFRRALEFCGCACRFGHDGKIHIFVPTVSGECYDSEYDMTEGQHTFFGQYYRETLVMPNFIIVKSLKDDDPQYSGEAVDTDSFAKIPKKKSFRMSLESDAQAGEIAQVILARAQLHSEAGIVEVPLNCGSELFDYVKVNDLEREGVSRIGNIGWLRRRAEPERNIYHMRFGFGDPPIVRSTREMYRALEKMGAHFERLTVKDAYIENLLVENIDAYWIDDEGNIDSSQMTPDFLDNIPQGEHYGLYKRMHLDASELYFVSNTIYTLRLPGEAVAKLWKSTEAPLFPETKDLWIDTNYTPNKVMRWSGSEWQELPAADVADLEKGIFIREVKETSLTADGLVMLHKVDTSGEFDLLYKADMSAHHLLLSAVIQSSSYRTSSDAEKTTWNAKVKTFVQASPPAGAGMGDLWFDSDDGYKVYRWTGAAWVTVQDGEITELRTDIEAGNIALSSLTTISGQWYNQSGLLMNAAYGIRLYGGQVAFSTHPSYADALNNTNIQVYAGTDGKLYAGAGAVALSSLGVKVKGAKLTLQDSAGGHSASLYVGTDGYLHAVAWTLLTSHLRPYGGLVRNIGSFYPYRYGNVFGDPVLTSTPLGGTVEGQVRATLGGSGDIKIYSNGAWRTNT